MIELIIVAFIAGVLTVLAPCILPLLPIVIGGSALHGDSVQSRSIKHPLIITLSLALSVIVFTLLLKATTVLLGVPTQVWGYVSGGIVLLLGINLLFPQLWDQFMIRTGLQAASNRLLSSSQSSSGIRRDMLLGFSLGPVFNSCSPTYALIVAVLLPASFASGFVYLLAYTAGLSLVLLLLGIFGQTLVAKLRWLSNPNGIFKKVIAVLFILVGLALMFGLERKLQAYVLDQGWYSWVEDIDASLKD